MPEWVQHVLTALSGGVLAWLATVLKIKAENRKTNTEADSAIVNQAKAVVEMWQQIGNSLSDKVRGLEDRVKILEADLETKADRIEELEEMNERKDERIKELETQVSELERKVQQLENSRQPRKRAQ